MVSVIRHYLYQIYAAFAPAFSAAPIAIPISVTPRNRPSSIQSSECFWQSAKR